MYTSIVLLQYRIISVGNKNIHMEMVGFPSGQREQTVNLSSNDFGGSNPPPTTIQTGILSGNSSVG